MKIKDYNDLTDIGIKPLTGAIKKDPSIRLWEFLSGFHGMRTWVFEGSHQAHVPRKLTSEILQHVDLGRSDETILVLFNPEFAVGLRDHKVSMGRVTFYSDHEMKTEFATQLKVKSVITSLDGLDMKFDIIIGNPPFQAVHDDRPERKDLRSNLWSLFWKKAFTLSTRNAQVALITPTSWISPSADLHGANKIEGHDRLWEVFEKYKSIANVTTVAEHFPGVGSTFGYVVVDKSKSGGLVFTHGADTTLGFLPKSEPERVQKALSKTNNLVSKYRMDQSNKPGLRVAVPISKLVRPELVQILTGSEQPKGSPEFSMFVYVYVSNQVEADKIRDRVLLSADVLNKHCRFSGFLNIQTLKMLSLDNL